MLEILTPSQMAQADRLAVASGPFDGVGLMLNAGGAIYRELLARYPSALRYDVLCGPGNNGGDGYVVAALLHESGLPVRLWRLDHPREGSDCAVVAARCPVRAQPLEEFAPEPASVVIDALFGAGLTRPLGPLAEEMARMVAEAGVPVVAIDLPSGLSGHTGRARGSCFRADMTVTFFRKKPGHLLEPGRSLCGLLVVADIGIAPQVLDEIAPDCVENGPDLWLPVLPVPDVATHKYARGHVGVFSGGASATGAARLAARAAARAGAGGVTVYSPASAMMVNAMHLTSIMLRRLGEPDELAETLAERPAATYVLGPGFGIGERTRAFALGLLGEAQSRALVLDADALTSFRDEPELLFQAAADSELELVLTPHPGEFRRLFPDLSADEDLSKVEQAREAAWRSNAVVILKGPDTVIAAPDGRTCINANGTPLLATAGSGDVLAGLCAGLAGQGMPAFEASCAAVWMHADAAARFGPGLIAEDLPGMLPAVLRDLLA